VQRWPELRAGLVALALAFGLIDGCPLPRRGHVPSWEQGFVEPLRSVQHVALTPVRWAADHLHIFQRWALYQAPSRDRFRLVIEGRDRTAAWRPLFIAGDPAHQDDADLIDYTRPRGIFDPAPDVPSQYAAFADWMTARVLARHPELEAARVSLERVRISDAEVSALGEFVQPHARYRRGGPR
jgi:hypothetical protein